MLSAYREMKSRKKKICTRRCMLCKSDSSVVISRATTRDIPNEFLACYRPGVAVRFRWAYSVSEVYNNSVNHV